MQSPRLNPLDEGGIGLVRSVAEFCGHHRPRSAVTKSIQELEDTLGVKLFQRSAKGMALTQDGHRFQASARKVIAAVAEASQLGLHKPEALTGSLSIGVTSLVAGYYLADLFARFQRSHPSVTISVVEDSPEFLEHLLINGEVDLAIMVSNTLGEPQALEVEVLTHSPCCPISCTAPGPWTPSTCRLVP